MEFIIAKEWKLGKQYKIISTLKSNDSLNNAACFHAGTWNNNKSLLLKELLWFECAVSIRLCFQCSFEAIESTWKKMVTTFEGYTCLWLTSSSFLPLCKQLPHVPATPDKVTYFAYDNELKFLTPWTQTSLSSLTLSLPGILSLWWEKYLSGSKKNS